MKSLRYLGDKLLEIQQVDIPEPGPEDVLVRVKGCGICGSDVHGWLGLTGRRIPPMTMGHEFAGEIAARGASVSGFAAGDLVAVQPINFCGQCVNCARGLTNMCLNKRFFGVLSEDGALAEYVAVPGKLLYKLSGGFDCHIAAMAEPYAVAYGSVLKAGSLEGKTVLIIGAGMIGQCVLQNVKLQNPGKIIMADLSDTRLAIAEELGADVTVNTGNEDLIDAVKQLTEGKMADVSFEVVGIEVTANMSVKCLKVGGDAVWVGMSQKEMTINMQDIVCSALSVKGSFNYTHEEFGKVVNLLAEGRFDHKKLLSRVISLEQSPDAFKALHDNPDDYLKIVVDPTLATGDEL